MKILSTLALVFFLSSTALAYDLSAPANYRFKDLLMFQSGGDQDPDINGRQGSLALCYGPFYEVRDGRRKVAEVLNLCPGVVGTERMGGDISGVLNIELFSLWGAGFGVGFNPAEDLWTYGTTFSFTNLIKALPDRPLVEFGTVEE